MISSIEKETAKNPAFLQKENGRTEHNQHHGSSHHEEDLKVKSLQRTVLMRRRTTEQITDVSCGTAALVGID